MHQVTIIGVGLIGGSFGMALRERLPSLLTQVRIIGCDTAETLEIARDCRFLDATETDPCLAVRNSDWVVLATPVGAIIDLIERIAPHLKAGALVTDVGSTKAEILARAQAVFGEAAPRTFLAGHPMAGKETGGIEHATPDLFQGSAWLFTPLPGQDLTLAPFGEFVNAVESFGARTMALDVKEHDRLCAWISHVPQLWSTALAAALVEEFGPDAPLLELGGRALREMTRIAASPYSMWRDVALTNRDNLTDALLQMEQRLAHIRENLNTRELGKEFEQAHRLKGKK